MKRLFLLLLIGALAYSLKAETSFRDLQSLTNSIAIILHRITDIGFMPKHLKLLEDAAKGGTNAPSAKAVADSIDFTNTFFETIAFEEAPPAEIIPELFDLLENDEICARRYVFLDGKYTNTYTQLVCELIGEKLDISAEIFTQKDEATLLWFPKEEYPYGDRTLLLFFWYYAGLKHLPTLWDDWYTIWKLENQRDVPRTNIIERLSWQISRQFSYHLFPLVAKAIEDGDKTLEPLIDKLPKRYFVDFATMWPLKPKLGASDEEIQAFIKATRPFFTNSTSFVSWWKDNKEKYIIPQPKRTLSDFKHVIRRKCGSSWICETRYKAILRLEKALDAYCAQKEHPISNCWYFTIKDEDGNKNE